MACLPALSLIHISAIRAAQLGAAVTIIEKKKLGGTCLNEGCIPTKAMLHSALLYHEAKTGRKCGIACDPTVDFPQVVAYKQSVSDRLIQGIDALLRAGSIRVVQGQASFADAHTCLLYTSPPSGQRSWVPRSPSLKKRSWAGPA